MRVLINAITITEGGGVVVLTRLLEYMSRMNATIVWYVAIDKNILHYIPSGNQIIPLPYGWVRKSSFHLLYWYEVELPKLISRLNINLFFSHTNFISRRRLSCVSLLLLHNAGFFSEEFTHLQLTYYSSKKDEFLWKQKINWSFTSIQRAEAITVQTAALAKRVITNVNICPQKIFVIPHGLGILNNIKSSAKSPPVGRCWRIGYVTKFGVQKDFDTAIKTIRHLKQAGISTKLILTLNQNMREYRVILKQIQLHGIEDLVENLGDVKDLDSIHKIYDSLDLFIFPSIIESFGFPIVEAMASGLPILLSSSESNLEIAAFAGNFFQIGNSKELASLIVRLMTNKSLYYASSENSLRRAKSFSWELASNKLINLMQEMVCKSLN